MDLSAVRHHQNPSAARRLPGQRLANVRLWGARRASSHFGQKEIKSQTKWPKTNGHKFFRFAYNAAATNPNENAAIIP